MQFTAILAILAATAATASPTGLDARTGSAPPTCSNNAVLACCTGLLNINLICNILALGNTCSSSSYCCNTNANNVIINASCIKVI